MEYPKLRCALVRHELVACLLTVFFASSTFAAVYEVGPGKPYASIGAVPIGSLNPGDVVRIYPKVGNAPYYEKVALSRNGTASQPITFQGVPDAQGNLPILDGMNAVQAGYSTNLDRGLIHTGSGSAGTGNYNIIENLELRNAYRDYQYFRGTTPYPYADNAAGVFVQSGSNVIVRNCWIHSNGNGVFAGGKSQGTDNLLIEACRVEGNGVIGSAYHHNFYVSAEPMVVQYNYIGGLRSGADGQNFKDRGSGTVLRYNWIEGGPNGQLDLVEGGTKPAHAYVYGNVLIKNNTSGNGRLVHFGGESASRAGTLYFANNTVVTTRSLTYVFQVSKADCTAQVHNNIIYYPGGGTFPQIRTGTGEVIGTYNWISPGYNAGGASLTDTISPAGNIPGFVNYAAQDFHLAAGSSCIDAGALTWTGQAQTTAIHQPVNPQGYEPRPVDGHIDIGAYEYVAPQPPQVTAVTPALVQVQHKSAALDRITITFSKDVMIGDLQVSVTGVNTGAHNNFSFNYDSPSKTATLQYGAGLPNDTYVVTVSDVVSDAATGAALDGEEDLYSPSLPSGNGTAGGSFSGLIYRLAGDMTGDRKVNVFDLQRLAASWNKQDGQAGYDGACDLTGDGKVNVFDLQVLAANWNQQIPVGP